MRYLVTGSLLIYPHFKISYDAAAGKHAKGLIVFQLSCPVHRPNQTASVTMTPGGARWLWRRNHTIVREYVAMSLARMNSA